VRAPTPPDPRRVDRATRLIVTQLKRVGLIEGWTEEEVRDLVAEHIHIVAGFKPDPPRKEASAINSAAKRLLDTINNNKNAARRLVEPGLEVMLVDLKKKSGDLAKQLEGEKTKKEKYTVTEYRVVAANEMAVIMMMVTRGLPTVTRDAPFITMAIQMLEAATGIKTRPKRMTEVAASSVKDLRSSVSEALDLEGLPPLQLGLRRS
jgi:hypothetical protein